MSVEHLSDAMLNKWADEADLGRPKFPGRTIRLILEVMRLRKELAECRKLLAECVTGIDDDCSYIKIKDLVSRIQEMLREEPLPKGTKDADGNDLDS